MTMRQLGGLVLVACLVPACSFIGVHGPQSRGVDCSYNRTAPAVDTFVAVGATVATIASLVSKSRHCRDESTSGEPSVCFQSLFVGVSLLVGVPYALSALYGHTTVSSCQRYRAQHADDARVGYLR